MCNITCKLVLQFVRVPFLKSVGKVIYLLIYLKVFVIFRCQNKAGDKKHNQNNHLVMGT